MSNEHEEKSVVLNFLAGLGLGALVGAATALLLAPKAGTETRQDIKNATEEFRAKANKVVHDLSESSEELVKKSKELLDATKAKVQSAVDAGKQAMACKKQEMEEKAEEG
ncbi:MAG: YtxH domain-containing protein [Armatimonadetes bacterium]|nr:YtxH domain-containing protein [Armatimonadota bacterium]